mmetsp:Transcript_41968/g.122812  ORF Transcript_41968/g.122812 Transcript_41968/m.122812 type:complete len:230 (+) Transcript_41968:92-781(+)
MWGWGVLSRLTAYELSLRLSCHASRHVVRQPPAPPTAHPRHTPRRQQGVGKVLGPVAARQSQPLASRRRPRCRWHVQYSSHLYICGTGDPRQRACARCRAHGIRHGSYVGGRRGPVSESNLNCQSRSGVCLKNASSSSCAFISSSPSGSGSGSGSGTVAAASFRWSRICSSREVPSDSSAGSGGAINSASSGGGTAIPMSAAIDAARSSATIRLTSPSMRRHAVVRSAL